jgi:hypothetical protein
VLTAATNFKACLKYEKYVHTFERTSVEVKAQFEFLANGANLSNKFKFPQLGGARVEYSISASPKVSKLIVGGVEIDDTKIYKIAASSYDIDKGFVIFQKPATFTVGALMFDELKSWVLKKECITPVVDGRVIKKINQ